MSPPLKTPPVFYTVVQVKFNAVLKFSEFLPAIQESFRKAGYPDFKRQTAVTLQVELRSDGSPPSAVPLSRDRYLFGSVNREHAFLLDADALTLQSTNYGRFESFSEAFLKGLGIVHTAVQLDFTERVGLRYLDRVMPRDSETLEHYLQPQVLGLGAPLGGKAIHSYFETLSEVQDVKLLSRVVIQSGPLALPPDMVGVDMVVAPRFLSFQGRSALLDNDGFVESREPFNLDTVGERLRAIHKVSGAAFHAAATGYAFKVWDEE
jgi:uncharacterized protein (TIGR04255 family)